MKRSIIFVLLLSMISLCLYASTNRSYGYSSPRKDTVGVKSIKKDSLPTTVSKTASTLLDADGNALDTSVIKLSNIYAWTVDTRFGERTLAAMDTVRENFHRTVLAEGQGIAVSYLGNIGGPLQQKEFFERKDVSQFPFMDVFEPWRRTPEKHLFLNTKVPYTNVQYQAGGGKQVAENRFKAELSSNFGKRLNVGFNFDYIYVRGFYKANFNKQTSYDFNASYIGDRYKMHAFVGNNNLIVSDNGGITDDRYITQPDAEGLANIRSNSLNIPVTFDQGLKNKLRGRHIFITNSYDIGRDQELVQVDDSTSVWQKKKNYIAPASVIFTTHYQDQRRQMTSSQDLEDLRRFDYRYPPDEKMGGRNEINDYMSHYTFTNTLAFRMNEGFRSWTKFGLTAFVEHEMRRFLLPIVNNSYGSEKYNRDALFFGGALSKDQGRFLKFNATVLKGINTNDMQLKGDISTHFQLFGKDVSFKANAYFKNIEPGFFQENFVSRNWAYRDLNFKDTKRLFLGGEIVFPKFKFSETSIKGGYENITDYIYYGENINKIKGLNGKEQTYRGPSKPLQSSKSVNILSLKLSQKLHMGIFHVEGQVLVQKSTDDEVIPLPLWTLYGNAYLQTKVSQVLTVQIGVDGYMHQKYYAPGFDPLQVQFYNQREVKIGHFPHANAYINLHLKYTRFFIMMSNIGESFGNRQRFTTPHYPTNPMMLRWGLSWRFNN